MTYRDLDVWKLSLHFVSDVYKLTANFPKHEVYGLSSQLQRAAVSIPSNIAEGSGRKSTKEFVQFLYIAKGSLLEIETQLEIAKILNYIEEIGVNLETIKRLRSMLNGLINKLENNQC
ncbi:MAG: four helix bundle protein [Candidatus Cloacimonetes bacterium HGW-Cloacimonetes-2]|jgi:four helix bundle protein|nr:MAG: four helix bundle protein [Candidatus Cloacimonetes bacterium HGW-Cloacimonetes-2]